ESVLFVVGCIEIIDEDLYIYATDISHVDISSVVKKKVSNLNNSQFTPEMYKSVRSKLLTAHQSASENSSKVPSVETNKRSIDLTLNDPPYSKHVKVENNEDNDNNGGQIIERNEEYVNENIEYENNIINENRRIVQKNKGKEKIIQSVIHNTRSRTEKSKNVNEK
ncbi:695_t:CDS:1, partial [Racocetra persica]